MKSVKDNCGVAPPTEAEEPPFFSSSLPLPISHSQWTNTSRHTRCEAGEAKTDDLFFRSSCMSQLPTSATGTVCSAGTSLCSCASASSSTSYWTHSMYPSEKDSICMASGEEDWPKSSVVSCSSSSPQMWNANETNEEERYDEREGWDHREAEPKQTKKKIPKIEKRSGMEKKGGRRRRPRYVDQAVLHGNDDRTNDDEVALASLASSSSASDPAWWKCKKLRKKTLRDHPIRVDTSFSLSTTSLRPPFGSVSSSSSLSSSTPYAGDAVEERAPVLSKTHMASSGNKAAHSRLPPPPRGGGGGGSHFPSSFSSTVEALAARAQRASSYFDPVLPEPSPVPSLDATVRGGGEERDASYYISELHRQVAEMGAVDEEEEDEEEEEEESSSSTEDAFVDEEEEGASYTVHLMARATKEKQRMARVRSGRFPARESDVLQRGKKRRVAPSGRHIIPTTSTAPAVASSPFSLTVPFFFSAPDGGAEEKGSDVAVEWRFGADRRVKQDGMKRDRKGEQQRKRGVKKKRNGGSGSDGAGPGESFVLLSEFEPWEGTLDWEEEEDEEERPYAEEGRGYSFSTSPCEEYTEESDDYLSSGDGGSSRSEDGSRSRRSNHNSSSEADEDGDHVCMVMEYSLEDMERMEKSSLTKKKKKKEKNIVKEKKRKDAPQRKVRQRKWRRLEREPPPSFLLAPLHSPSALPPPLLLPPTKSRLRQQETSLEQLFDCTTAH